MKLLKLKTILCSLITVVMISVFLSSCEYDPVGIFPDYDNPSYVKEISIQGINDSKDFQFKFEIASNDETLINSFGKESITMEFLNQQAVEDMLNDESDSKNNTGPQNPEKENDSNGNSFVKITLMQIITSNTLSEVPPYELHISPEVNEIIKEMKATTVLDFEQSIKVANASGPSSRGDYVELWNKNKRVHLRGDCGTNWSRTKNYWADYGESYDPDLFLSETWFKCNTYIGVCCRLVAVNTPGAWIRRVTVINDVLSSYTALSNSCDGADYCISNTDNYCSGYYPAGCWD